METRGLGSEGRCHIRTTNEAGAPALHHQGKTRGLEGKPAFAFEKKKENGLSWLVYYFKHYITYKGV